MSCDDSLHARHLRRASCEVYKNHLLVTNVLAIPNRTSPNNSY